jgi:hypothetical protein
MQRVREDSMLGKFGVRCNYLLIVQNSKDVIIICTYEKYANSKFNNHSKL